MMEAGMTVPTIHAMVSGKPFLDFPNDLFIPPDALEVLLDSFSGPLDLLLYLIRQHDMDILDIPMTLITEQYMRYINILEKHRLELAAEYLVMAAVLAEIKSRMLLPPQDKIEEGVEEDPRMELVRRLQAYEEMKRASLYLDELPRLERDVFYAQVPSTNLMKKKEYSDVALSSLVDAMKVLWLRQHQTSHHQISREALSVRERMTSVLHALKQNKLIEFSHLMKRHEGRAGLVVTMLAILELARLSLILITQTDIFSAVYIQAYDHE